MKITRRLVSENSTLLPESRSTPLGISLTFPQWILLFLVCTSSLACYGGEAHRPKCDEEEVIEKLWNALRTGPDITAALKGTPLKLFNIKETVSKHLPEIGTNTYQRMCWATLQFEDMSSTGMGWSIFTTGTILGSAYGIDMCVEGMYRAQDCRAYSEGRIPFGVKVEDSGSSK